MIYVSVIATLILIIRFIEMLITCAFIEHDRRKMNEYRKKQDLINDEMVMLHRNILIILEDKYE